MYVCTLCHTWCRGADQMRVSDLPELELQEVVSYLVAAEKQMRASARAVSTLDP